jgi:protein MpaA
MNSLKPTEKRRLLSFKPKSYGRSARGLPLDVSLPASGETDLPIFTAVHSKEAETTALLSKALRALSAAPERCAMVLSANPDGAILGTRGKARGVVSNCNFPSSNWQAAPVLTRWSKERARVVFSTGSAPGSEPERQALIRFIELLISGLGVLETTK